MQNLTELKNKFSEAMKAVSACEREQEEQLDECVEQVGRAAFRYALAFDAVNQNKTDLAHVRALNVARDFRRLVLNADVIEMTYNEQCDFVQTCMTVMLTLDKLA